MLPILYSALLRKCITSVEMRTIHFDTFISVISEVKERNPFKITNYSKVKEKSHIFCSISTIHNITVKWRYDEDAIVFYFMLP